MPFRLLADSLGVGPLNLTDGALEEFYLTDYRDMAGYSTKTAAAAAGLRPNSLGDFEKGRLALSGGGWLEFAISRTHPAIAPLHRAATALCPAHACARTKRARRVQP